MVLVNAIVSTVECIGRYVNSSTRIIYILIKLNGKLAFVLPLKQYINDILSKYCSYFKVALKDMVIV